MIFIVGGVVTASAVTVELAYEPPFWVHILFWFPLTALLTIGLLRLAKGLLIALEYQNRAREGRIAAGE